MAVLGVFIVALAAGSPTHAAGQSLAGGAAKPYLQQSTEVISARLADQLGVKLAPNQADELAIGASVTSSLVDAGKLASFGVRDVRAGARVTITRIAADRVRLEIDEMDPTPRTTKVTLRIDNEGRLTPVL